MPISPGEYCSNCKIIDFLSFNNYILALRNGGIVYAINTTTFEVDNFQVLSVTKTASDFKFNGGTTLAVVYDDDIVFYSTTDPTRLRYLTSYSHQSSISSFKFIDINTFLIADYDRKISLLSIVDKKMIASKTLEYSRPDHIVTAISINNFNKSQQALLGFYSGHVTDINFRTVSQYFRLETDWITHLSLLGTPFVIALLIQTIKYILNRKNEFN